VLLTRRAVGPPTLATLLLQNSIANVPNLANVLIAWRQTKAAAGLSDKITLRQFIALLSQQAQVYDNGSESEPSIV